MFLVKKAIINTITIDIKAAIGNATIKLIITS